MNILYPPRHAASYPPMPVRHGPITAAQHAARERGRELSARRAREDRRRWTAAQTAISGGVYRGD